MEWKTIDSVPKNTWVLTGTSDYVLRTRLFDNSKETRWVNEFGVLHTWRPTHWMPLPEPPQEKQSP
ncbi:DUF551 domain-containing protein [Dyadobacter sandarakinus]|uniref:DUF551 domain-containing protein n=1 Tax=Dyadobacter sandarakinus TaxID=2747268 RepID=A0ABX7I1G3_9BACT|nr:DUF551 domain-containing protein [Dyadobacter sandarakinus]